jgi:hypothetical protein
VPLPAATRREYYAYNLRQAQEWADELGEPAVLGTTKLDVEFGELRFFNVG